MMLICSFVYVWEIIDNCGFKVVSLCYCLYLALYCFTIDYSYTHSTSRETVLKYDVLLPITVQKVGNSLHVYCYQTRWTFEVMRVVMEFPLGAAD